MISKRLIALVLLSALAAAPSGARGQWVQTNGPYGGIVFCFAINNSHLFAGTELGGVFRSTNYGVNWTKANFGLPKININTLASSGESLFAGTDSGLYRSTDEGASWQSDTSKTLNGWGGYPIVWAIHAGSASLLVGTSSGLFRTTDNGSNWERLSSMWVNCFAEMGDTLFAGEFSGVFRSTNDGISWTQVNKGLSDTNVESMIAVGTTLFVGCFGHDNDIFRSSNNGTTWIKVSNGLPVPDSIFRGIAALGTDGSNVFAATQDNGVYRSTNNGSNWVAVNNGLSDGSFQAFALLHFSSNIVVGTAAGAYLTADSGNSWREINDGLGSASVPCLLVSGKTIYAGTEFHGLFQSSNDGTSWSLSDSGLINSSIWNLAQSDTSLYAGTSSGIFRSNALTWMAINTGLPMYNSGPLATSEKKIFVAYGSSVFSISNADTTASALDSIPRTGITALLSSGASLFAGTAGEGIFRSTEGLVWTWASVGLTDTIIQSLATNGTYLFAATNSGVSRSSDTGKTWSASAVTGWRPNWATINAFYVDGEDIFIATNGAGIFLSSNNGEDWKDVNAGLPYSYGTFTYVKALSMHNNVLFAGTGSGIWRRPLSEMIGPSAVTEATPSKRSILCYPNPFSQSTHISFTTDAAGYADVSIVNLLGTEVANLFSGTLGAGEHSFEWDAAKVAAPEGIYECVVRSGGRVQAMPIALAR